MSDTRTGSCKICSSETKSRCSNCNQVFYCSVAHQKADWRSHKNLCRPFKVEISEQLGRHLVTTRKINPFEIVLRETPLLRGPSHITGPVCLGCLNGVDESEHVCCEKCGWPLCCKECENSEEHKEECELSSKRSQKRVTVHEFTTPHPLYQCMTTLRALLLKKSNPEKFEKLRLLEAHEHIRRGSPQWRLDEESVGKFIPKFFQTNEFSEDEIMKLCGIVQINGHEVPTTEPSHIAIYELASMVEHSCKPNLAKSFTKDDGIIFWSLSLIPRNTNLSICYSDALWGTNARQQHLMHTKLFKCTCVRCTDVTELGTYYSALKCKKQGCSGYVLPTSLEKWQDHWKCLSCEEVMDKIIVNDTLKKAGAELCGMEKNMSNNLKYISKYENLLPLQHYYFTEVKIQVVQQISLDPKDLPNISDDMLDIKLKYSKELVELLEQVAPCESRTLGMISFEAHAAISEKTRRLTMQGSVNVAALLEESLKYVEKAMKYLQYEPEIFIEGLTYKQAQANRHAIRLALNYS